MKSKTYIDKFSAEEIDQLKKLCTDKTYNPTPSDLDVYFQAIERASDVWGEDQIVEAVKYITASLGGLRPSDLSTLIGEDWNEGTFEEFNNSLGFSLISKIMPIPGTEVYMFPEPIKNYLLEKFRSHETLSSFTSDIAYHLLNLEGNDSLRIAQTMPMLLSANLPYEAAEYIANANGEALRMAVIAIGNALIGAPEDVKETVWKMTEVTDFDRSKLFLLLINDVLGMLGKPDLQKEMIVRIHQRLENILTDGGSLTMVLLLGITKLRIAQNARIRREEKEAENAFVAALNGIMKIAKETTPEEFPTQHIDILWLALKICQEMAQPKAMVVIFDTLTEIERTRFETEGDPKQKEEIREKMLSQHIDMSKLYYALPQPLKEQFKDYSEQTLSLIDQVLAEKQNTPAEEGQQDQFQEIVRRSSLYQAKGEICLNAGKMVESCDALTEAQIIQERQLGQLTKQEGPDHMSEAQLLTRLTLSVTNHLLGIHYRQDKKGKHDLSMVLNTNMTLAKDCFKHFPTDGRVIHFLINASLELGDFLHSSNSFVPERETYQTVVHLIMSKIQNLRLDETLCRDVAMIHSKLGQIQMHFKQMRDAKQNLTIGHNLWAQLAENTHNKEFENNAEATQKLLDQIK